MGTNKEKENQLKLAMTWNRADIAQEEILREDANWKEGKEGERLGEREAGWEGNEGEREGGWRIGKG